MRKDEFLQILRQALEGDVPPGVIEENIRYYNSYITDEVRKGRLEEEVIAEIGDPRLIARTIEDTTDGAGDNQYRGANVYEDTGSRRAYGQQGQSSSSRNTIHYFNLNKWYWKLLLCVIIFVVLSVVFAVIGGIFRILSPILYPLLLFWLIMTLIRSFNRR